MAVLQYGSIQCHIGMLLNISFSGFYILVEKVMFVVCCSRNISQQRSLDMLTPRYFVWFTCLTCCL